MITAEPRWEVKTMKGTLMGHPFIVTNPSCPEGRHPTRDCGCKVFRYRKEAETYAAERNAS